MASYSDDMNLVPSTSTRTIFKISKSSSRKFGPRIGQLRIERSSAQNPSIVVDTPGFAVSTSRGIIPHLSRDHVKLTEAIRWVNVPFESFLERDPPLPISHSTSTSAVATSARKANPLRSLLGFSEAQMGITLSLRDPFDTREMPPNGNKFVNALCIRGVRKMTPQTWYAYASSALSSSSSSSSSSGDLLTALSDTPFTSPPFSQKRLTKSIERSIAWLGAHLLLEAQTSSDPGGPPYTDTQPRILLPMPGDISLAARRAFSSALTEAFESNFTGKEAEQLRSALGIESLDEAVFGYVFELGSLRRSMVVAGAGNGPDAGPRTEPSSEQKQKQDEETQREARMPLTHPHPDFTPRFAELLQASLDPLVQSHSYLDPSGASTSATNTASSHKPRFAHTTVGPHEVLALISEVGIDMFDAHWAQKAADWGVALDFRFPVDKSDFGYAEGGEKEKDGNPGSTGNASNKRERMPRIREDGTRDLGHNLYDVRYAGDFTSLSACFGAGVEFQPVAKEEMDASQSRIIQTCPCAACSPVSPTVQLSHSSIDIVPNPHTSNSETSRRDPPFTRAYLHHLLHTHEMSAHALLVMHNLAVLDKFFTGVRRLLSVVPELPPSPTDSESPSELLNDELFAKEVTHFCSLYDARLRVLDEAKRDWIQVDFERGKGRLAREKAKMAESDLGTEVELKESLL